LEGGLAKPYGDDGRRTELSAGLPRRSSIRFSRHVAPNLSNRVDGSDSLLVAGMLASPHQLSVLKTVRHKSDQGLSEGAIGSFDDHHLAVAAKVRGRARLRRLLIAFVIIVFFVGVWLTEVPWT
jgi:hypothetical protein